MLFDALERARRIELEVFPRFGELEALGPRVRGRMFVRLARTPACRDVLDLDGHERKRLGLGVRVHESFAVELPETKLLAGLVAAVEGTVHVDFNAAQSSNTSRGQQDMGACLSAADVTHPT